MIHHAHGAGNFVDHDFAEKAFAGGGNFSFAHAGSMPEKSGAFNARMPASSGGKNDFRPRRFAPPRFFL
jgi:hypothetical protein